ncbi:MAG: hypothetical protein AABZ47_17885 [Planctomycetota bacterium]
MARRCFFQRSRTEPAVGERSWKKPLLQTVRIVAVGVAWLWTSVVLGTGATEFSRYEWVESFTLPTGADVFDVLNDGRIVLLVDDQVHVETSSGSRSFTVLGVLPDAGGMAFPAFVRVSPDGTKIAVGDNAGLVGVFAFPALTGTWFTASHFDGEWFDNQKLALSGGTGFTVTLLDTTSADPQNPMNPTLVTATGFAGGITFDSAGNLYTGNGFSGPSDPTQTGEAKYFPVAAWMAVLSGSPALNFVTQGTLVVDILSAAPLGFDSEGNLFVGGGDFFGGSNETDFAAVVKASVVTGASGGGDPADIADVTEVRRFDPDTVDTANFYSLAYNSTRGELYMQSFGISTMHVFRAVDVAPATSPVGLGLVMVLMTVSGVAVLRHRRSCKP